MISRWQQWRPAVDPAPGDLTPAICLHATCAEGCAAPLSPALHAALLASAFCVSPCGGSWCPRLLLRVGPPCVNLCITLHTTVHKGGANLRGGRQAASQQARSAFPAPRIACKQRRRSLQLGRTAAAAAATALSRACRRRLRRQRCGSRRRRARGTAPDHSSRPASHTPPAT